MPVNPNIALAVKPIELANPLNAYAQIEQLRGAQQQNALAQMQMQEYERARGEEEQLRNYLAKKPDLTSTEGQASLLTQFGKTGRETLKSLGEFQKAQTEEASRKAKLVEDKLKQSKSFLEGVTTPEQYMQWHEANHADPVLGSVLAARGITAESSRARIEQAMKTPGGFQRLLNESKLGTEKFIERTTVTEADRQRIAQEGQRIGLEGRRVAVMEEQNRLAKDPVFQQQMAAAKATGEAIAKNDVAAKQVLPGVLLDAERQLNLIDQMVGKQEVRDKSGKVLQAGTAAHPGFAPAVGAGGFGTLGIPGIARFTPGTDAADFQTLFDQVKGGAFLEAYNVLRGAGAITKDEGDKATASRTRMALAQSEKEFVTAAREYQEVIRKGVEVMQKRAAGGGGAAPAMPAGAGGAVDTNNPLLK